MFTSFVSEQTLRIYLNYSFKGAAWYVEWFSPLTCNVYSICYKISKGFVAIIFLFVSEILVYCVFRVTLQALVQLWSKPQSDG